MLSTQPTANFLPRKLAPVDAGAAFMRKDLENRTIVGYSSLDPKLEDLIPVRHPKYHFRDDHLRVMKWFWERSLRLEPWQDRKALLAMGPKGAGKTSLGTQFASRLRIPLISITLNRRTELRELIQNRTIVDGDVFEVDGPVRYAAEQGCGLLLNEIDLLEPGELTGLNDLVERGTYTVPDTGNTIHAQKGFFVMGTMNTRGRGDDTGGYAGTNVMNTAFLSRAIKLWVDYPTPEEEFELLADIFPKARETAAAANAIKTFIAFANKMRAAYLGADANVLKDFKAAGGAIEDTMSTRELITWIEASRAFKGMKGGKDAKSPAIFAFDVTIGFTLDPALRTGCHELLQRMFNEPTAAAST